MNSASDNTGLPPVIFLMGPTATGKTQVALGLAQQLPCEIISVDSALVYRGMDIGTAKPDKATLSKVPHRLIDIRDPADSYSVATFRADALREIADITARGKVPLLVGGTMLYFKSLLDGLAEMPATDPQVRADVLADAARLGWPALHARLAGIDPGTAACLHPNHSQRIGRALEVYLMTGKTMSSFRSAQPENSFPYRVLQLALLPENKVALHARIGKRFHDMMDSGFLAEVEMLYKRRDLHIELPAMRAVGYREAWRFLSGSLTREQMVARAIISTRQLAKRQMTWLRGWRCLQLLAVDLATAHSLDSTVAEIRQRAEVFLRKE
jgi:tRNA dimethylallyltransferase